MDLNKIYESGERLPLVEDFYTIQGEGYHIGKPAYFIRIGGCDICCDWCDSKISWNPKDHDLVDIKDIVNNALNTPAKAIVVTGGEPSRYNLEPLTRELRKHNIEIYLETAGVKPLTGSWDWICLSPKTNKHPDESNYKLASELKVVIRDIETDFKWAEDNAKKVGENCKLFLQSEWSRYKVNIPYIVEYVKKNPQWNISLQAHKFMNIP